MIDAQQSGLLPPNIQPQELGGDKHKPSLDEFHEVLGLHHLVRCAEARYRNLSVSGANQFYGEAEDQFPFHEAVGAATRSCPEDIGSKEAWRARFDAAAYTSLLLGAGLTRVYREPFPVDSRHPAIPANRDRREEMDGRSWSILFKVNKHNVRSDGYTDLSPAEIDYLLQFPVYNLHVDLEKQKDVFGPLANWFMSAALNEARTQVPFSPPVPTPRINKKLFNVVGPSSWPEGTSLSDSFPSGTATEGNTVFSAIMRSIHMYEILKHCFAHSDRWSGNRPASAMLPRRVRTVRAILFGTFRPQQIIMPANASDSVSTTLSTLDIQGPTPTLDLDLIAGPLLMADNHMIDTTFIASLTGNISATIPPGFIQFYTFLLAREFSVGLGLGPASPLRPYWMNL